jgi:transglutaminase-like putative cysteine protease
MILNRSTMSVPRILADYQHPLVRETAERLSLNESTVRGKIERLFYFVRDKIKFGFPADGDLVKASATIRSGIGQCNTKGTLFLALCRALGIPARQHFSTIKKDIQRGLFTGLAYQLMPAQISHSWLEVKVDGSWRKLDSHINDEPFYESGKKALRARHWDTGYSIANRGDESSAAFNLDKEAFAQMDAVLEDHGVWDEPGDYYASPKYRNRPGFLSLLLYRLLIGSINKRVEGLRHGATESMPAHRASQST